MPSVGLGLLSTRTTSVVAGRFAISALSSSGYRPADATPLDVTGVTGVVVLAVDGSGAANDGCAGQIEGQLASLGSTLDVDGNGAIDALSDGLLILRYLFGFRGSALITGAIGAGCTRCDAASVEAYIGSLL